VVAFCVCLFVDIETLSDFQKFWFGAANNNYILIRFILDSTILFASLAMTLFVWLRFRERWILSIIIDAIQTVFWILLATGNDQHPKGPNINSYWIMVASSLTMLIAAVYGAYNWWSQRKAK
jgi:nicotinamide riboside transporter PnuC